MPDVYILGAGFSKAINPLMPTMQELTDAVGERIATLARYAGEGFRITLPSPLKDLEDESKELEKNVELWMTYLAQSQPWLDEVANRYNQAVAVQIREHIRRFVDDRTWRSMTPTAILSDHPSTKPQWLNSLIQQWHDNRATVISLNYDTLIERASLTLSDGNAPDSIHLRNMYPPYFSNMANRATLVVGPNPMDTFRYFKLHGSVNWHYSGRDDFFGETIYHSHVSPWGQNMVEYERDSLESAGDKTPLIIPPVTEKTTYFNNETVRRLWRDASLALSNATRVFVIGYSLPLSDLGMQFFLKHSLPAEHADWYIVDTNRRVLVRYRKLLEPYQTVRGDFVCREDPVAAFVECYPELPAL